MDDFTLTVTDCGGGCTRVRVSLSDALREAVIAFLGNRASEPATVPAPIAPTMACCDHYFPSKPGEGYARRLRMARQERGFSREFLANKSGCSISTVRNAESDTVLTRVRVPTLARMAVVLGCNPLWLVTGEGEPGFAAEMNVTS